MSRYNTSADKPLASLDISPSSNNSIRGPVVTMSYNATIKEDFSEMYSAPDPLQYLRRMEEVEYQIPHHAQPLHQAFVVAAGGVVGVDGRVGVIDVGCSYGVNAALLNGAAGLTELFAHYRHVAVTATDPAAIREYDRRYWRTHTASGIADVHGADSSNAAIRYALDVALLHKGLAANLEDEAINRSTTVAVLPRDHVLISTGAVGYVTARTMAAIVAHMARPRMLLVFVLRSVDYGDCIAAYEAEGMTTRKLPGLYPQRRFASVDEHDRTIDFLAARGVDTRAAEQRGYQYAECYLTSENHALVNRLAEQLSPLVGTKEPLWQTR